MLPQRADVVIIGGGIIGASIAYYLAKGGVEALLIERSSISSATSGSCDGFVFMQSKKPGIHLELALESAKRFETLEAELGAPIEYENCGGMVVIEGEEEFPAMEQYVKEQRVIGLDVTLLGVKEAREREPALSEKIIGATYSPQDSQVNPMFLTFAFIDRARELGARVFTDTRVTAIDGVGGREWIVRTETGEIKTELVVNAAGPFAPEIGRMVGLEIPITPRRGQLLVTETLPNLITSIFLSAQYIAAKFNPELAKTAGEGISIEQTASGTLVLGSTREFVGYDTGVTNEGISAIAARAAQVIPRLNEVHIIRTFAGLRPYTPSGLPFLGFVEGLEGFIMAAGHEGDGIALAPITGDLIAQLILSGKTDIPLDAFQLGLGGTPWKPALVLSPQE